MKVRVDQDKCIGCGLCASLAEAIFTLNDEGKAEAGQVSPDDEAAAQDAAANCPVEAISVD